MLVAVDNRPASSPAAGRVGRGGGARDTRPPGHPEGYLEGFADIYSEVALAIKAARWARAASGERRFPTIVDGVKGLAFVEAAVKSSKANGRSVKPETA